MNGYVIFSSNRWLNKQLGLPYSRGALPSALFHSYSEKWREYTNSVGLFTVAGTGTLGNNQGTMKQEFYKKLLVTHAKPALQGFGSAIFKHITTQNVPRTCNKVFKQSNMAL